MLRGTTVILSLMLLATVLQNTDQDKIIVEVDTGIDDYQALVALFNAEFRKEIEIVAIVCSDGKVELEHVLRNTVRFLEAIGRTEIPVYAGSFKPILPRENIERVFGLDGFGDLGLEENLNMSIIREEIAPTAINTIVKSNPKEITYLALGPATNLALAFRMYEGVAENLNGIFIMGGNYQNETVEYNFLGDPEAAHIVISEAKTPVLLLPFQTCINPSLNYGWRFGINMTNYVWDLNDRAEMSIFGNSSEGESYFRCDTLLAALFIRPKEVLNVTFEKPVKAVKVGLCDESRGLLIIDSKEGAEITIIDSINVETYKLLFVQEFNEICKNYKCKSIEV